MSVIPEGGGPSFTAKGTVENAKKGADVELHGEWVDWKTNTGRVQQQFSVKTAYVTVNPEEAAAIQFLSSGIYKGIGEATACKIVEKLGTDIPSYIGNIKKMTQIPGISEAKASVFAAAHVKNGALYPVYRLTGGEITLGQAQKIYEKYGDDTESVLRQNPYLLVYEVDSFGFRKADDLALKAGHVYDSDERVSAGMVCSLSTAGTGEGHCFLYEQELIDRTLELLMPPTRMGAIYYQGVLNTAVPSGMNDWRETTLASLITDSPRTVDNMISAWAEADSAAMTKYEKSHRLSAEEVETLNLYTVQRADFERNLVRLLGTSACVMDGVKPEDAIRFLYKAENAGRHLISDTDPYGIRRYYDRRSYIREVVAAQTLSGCLKLPVLIEIEDDDIKSAVESFEKTSGTSLGHEQKLAVETSLKNRVSIITGGPGRGKTTIEKVIIDCWTAKGGDILLLAPTGRAAQRMSEATGAPAMTIHRALMQIKGRSAHSLPGKSLKELTSEENRTLIIIDECSMIDMTLAVDTINAFGNCHLLFIGDADQLPSVGAGEFFESLINSGTIPCTRLIECYRNSGSISNNSDIINRGGKLSELEKDHQFKIIYSKEPAVVADNIVNVYRKMLTAFDRKDICIIVPMRQRGKTSANEINRRIQAEFNPPNRLKKEFKQGLMLFREGDRVMQTKNNYNLVGTKGIHQIEGVFNGETGEIVKISDSASGLRTEILFDDGKKVIYSHMDMAQLTLAYAITAHKSQGSEYPCVIMAFVDGDYMLLCRKIIYTAESRGKQMVILLGSPSAIQRSISNAVYAKRNTALAERLRAFA